MRRRPARSRILKKSPRAPGGDRARSRRRRRSPRGLVRRRGPHRPEEQDHPAMGQTGLAAERPERPANRLSLHLRGDLPEGRQGRGARHAPLRHRGDEPASGRNRHADRARRPRRAAHRSGRLASLRPPRRPAQHHAHLAARKVPRTEPAGKRMAVHARQLAVEPSLQILRRHRQPLLRRLEQARRSALENHLHRNARLGVWVLISESWYNEIVAIPALLDMLSIEGAVVTIDAIGCQRDIAQKIIDKKADYILALKGNQGTLRNDVELFANEQKARGFADTQVSVDETVDGDHGRIETRRVTVIHDVAWLQQRHEWPGLKGLVIVDSTREIGAKTERETRYYLTSSSRRADRLGPMARDHWAIENGLPWVMDMTFRDDECRIRTDNAPENVVTLKHMAVNLARKAKGRDSVRLALKTAAWDDDYLAKLIAA